MAELGGSDHREEFLASARSAREKRAEEKRRSEAVLSIQAGVRGFLARRRAARMIRQEFDATLGQFKEIDRSLVLCNAEEGFTKIKHLFFVFDDVTDKERFYQLCRYLLCSLDCQELKKNTVYVALKKEHIISWVRLMKKILWHSCKYLEVCRTELPAENKLLSLHLHMLVSFTACSSWALLKSGKGEALRPSMTQLCSNILADLVTQGIYKKLSVVLRRGLCRNKPTLNHTSLSAIVSVALRPLINANFSEGVLVQFLCYVLTTPALVFHLQSYAQECVALLMTQRMFERLVLLLTTDNNTRAAFSIITGVDALSLLANLIHLGALEKEVLVENLLDFTNVMTRVLEKCRESVVSKKSQTNHWHPVLGWFSQPVEQDVQHAMQLVVRQLQMLWSGEMVRCLFRDLLSVVPPDSNSSSSGPTFTPHKDLVAPVKILLRKLLEKQNSTRLLKKLGTPETTIVALVCSLYQSALSTFSQLHYDILSGLCYQDFLLPKLWAFISSMGPENGLRSFQELLAHNPHATSPEFQILILFCDIATYLITILDDVELYEDQKPFQLVQLVGMAKFANVFVFRLIWEDLIDLTNVSSSLLFNSLHGFLKLLYSRDCRRSFTNPNFWLIQDLKPSSFMAELEKGSKKAEILIQKAPHIIPHKERFLLFRKYVNADREALGIGREMERTETPSTMIAVHRSRLVEDGYRQLSLLPARTLKGTVRVRFVNEQGLDEAGIDQDGVFKEFLEETILKVFDPALNLFKRTSEETLYPSPTSNIHENHLSLFDFVGRMLGKAVYEGIVVEVPFASFFLTHLIGKASGVGYSSIDELPSMDPDLYKSLTYIKHFEGDVSELELTFSCDEDCMGQVVTEDLVPGGRTLAVTNENKISYIHHMAHFRMYKQIRDQITAFVRGFRALIRPEWLTLFSAAELQKLISGACEDIDIPDLRKHTQYYGGFHSNHRLILWLWDILDRDFSAEERRMFLKFVTSCSKPPLLGFAHLEPGFSIRCVEVGDDQDHGDTLGSVIRGFLAIRKKEVPTRLPTSSTCFNLLKLPNYQKKSTLKEKLRYAIHSGTGFELS